MTNGRAEGAAAGPRLAVLGAGEVGCGWAALAAAHGRAVAMHDSDGAALERAVPVVRARAGALVAHSLADRAAARTGLDALSTHTGLEEAVAAADWVIEAAPESLGAKQELLARAETILEAVARGPVLASSSSGLHASALAERLRHPDRLLVVHPLVPVELIPIVEVIPGPLTAPEVIEVVRAELFALGRTPIVLRKEVSGNAVGRIAAAVWRESIDLVLDGVLDAADLDRLVAEGPGLGWASGGPHLTYEIAAGDAGMAGFLDHLLPTFEAWWAALSERTTLEPGERGRLASLVAAAYDEPRAELRRGRDERLISLVKALSEAGARH